MTPLPAAAAVILPALSSNTTTDPAYAAGSAVGGLLGLVITVLITGFALKGIFTKAGQPTWAAFVPVYNIAILLRIAGLSPWLVILFFVPILNIVAQVLLAINVAKVFGKGLGTVFLIFFFSIIMYFVLSYGSARYLGREAALRPLGSAPQAHAGSY